MLDEPPTEEQPEEAPDSMALALTAAAKRPRMDDPFALYVVDSEGPPVIHVSRTRRSEIVIFGRSQKLLPPVVLGSGAVLLNAADKDDEIEISKIVPSKFNDSDVKLRTSLDLPEVIRRVANLGTTYPEMVAILEAANRQKNLPGTLVVDAVPHSNMDYLQAAILGKDLKAKVDPAAQRLAALAVPLLEAFRSTQWQRCGCLIDQVGLKPERLKFFLDQPVDSAEHRSQFRRSNGQAAIDGRRSRSQRVPAKA